VENLKRGQRHDSYALQKAKAIVESFRQLAFGTDNKPADPAGDLSFTQALVNRFKRTGETVVDAFNPEKSVALNSAPVKAAQAAIVGVVKRAGDVAGQG
jgi:hypothetical protein